MRTPNFPLHLPLLIPLLWVVACGAESKAVRDWTPDDHGHPPTPPSDQAQPPAQPEAGGQARAARALWQVSCAGCHGRNGLGDGPTPPPGAQMPNFATAEFQASRTDAQLVLAMKEGKGMMPSFAKQLNESGFAALVQLIRSFGPPAKGPTRDTGHTRDSP